ncbi:DNA topoisomerase IV subunit A [Malacoplasma penetrans]|uniref:DNA topoisomerase IV subunit A n=1 Tax=Malacoplasma penetrans TaxID=28227 RepID=UPI0013E8F7CB|nr:DNA topoisomerase IV subunit A [Malacoplasma penetrans]
MSKQNDKIWNRSLDDIMSESFGKYAKYIIQDRALPDVRDGLKPVQRRILHAMNELKIHHDKPYKKSARTVGEVIGKYHPHGDNSIYEAMVRMSQEWKNNLPLLDMQGNKGSIDGDSPAAMRYTECRLSKFGQTILKDIDKNTVKFINNFDDSEQEPTVLPSLLPNILINGATGIAAGYATNIPPFNPSEVIDGTIYRILRPESSLAELAKIIKGPDFPTGGIIQGKEFIQEIYKTGKGKFFIRAKIEEEPTKSTKNVKRLIVKEIPYDTNKSAIVKSLDEIKYNNELPGFKEVRDDSDKNGISIVLEFDTEKDLEIIKTFLYKKTQLQISYNANMVLIKDRKPVQAGLLEILDSFIEHANNVVIKAAQYDLEKSLLRKEIIEGLIKAISEIDVLVNLIKSSVSKEEAKLKIQDYFKVNERQSEAIVNLRLYVLTSFDTEKLKKEYEELLEFIKEKELIINSVPYRNKFIVSILENHKKNFGYKRRSLIENEVEELEIETVDIVEERNGTCIVTRDNYIKFIDDVSIEELDLSKAKIKDADIPVDIFRLSTLDHLVCLTNRGKMITIPAYKIKMTKLKDNGVHINELITIDSFEKTILAFGVSKYSDINTEILVATKNSLIKRISLEDINLSKNAKSSTYVSLKGGNDDVVSAYILKKEYSEVVSVTQNGYATRYKIDEIPLVGRTAAGVKNMSLKDKDLMAFTVPIPKHENFLFFISNRGAKRIHINDIVVTSRSKLGKRIFQQIDSNPYIVNSGFMVGGRSNVFMLLESNELVSLKVAEIPITEADSRMNLITKIGKSSILKGTYLTINKSHIETSQTNNFLTLNSEKSSSSELKENSDDNEDDEHHFVEDDVEIIPIEKLKKQLEKQQPKENEFESSTNFNILEEMEKNKNSSKSNTKKEIEPSIEKVEEKTEDNQIQEEELENNSDEIIEESDNEELALEDAEEENEDNNSDESDDDIKITESEDSEDDNSEDYESDDENDELEDSTEETEDEEYYDDSEESEDETEITESEDSEDDNQDESYDEEDDSEETEDYESDDENDEEYSDDSEETEDEEYSDEENDDESEDSEENSEDDSEELYDESDEDSESYDEETEGYESDDENDEEYSDDSEEIVDESYDEEDDPEETEDESEDSEENSEDDSEELYDESDDEETEDYESDDENNEEYSDESEEIEDEFYDEEDDPEETEDEEYPDDESDDLDISDEDENEDNDSDESEDETEITEIKDSEDDNSEDYESDELEDSTEETEDEEYSDDSEENSEDDSEELYDESDEDSESDYEETEDYESDDENDEEYSDDSEEIEDESYDEEDDSEEETDDESEDSEENSEDDSEELYDESDEDSESDDEETEDEEYSDDDYEEELENEFEEDESSDEDEEESEFSFDDLNDMEEDDLDDEDNED